MEITYLKMNNGSLSINLSDSVTVLNPAAVNYNPILKSLEDNTATEESIKNLLNIEITDGLYYAIDYNGSLLLRRIDPKTFHVTYSTPDNKKILINVDAINKLPSMGTYASKKDLIADFPEYFI